MNYCFINPQGGPLKVVLQIDNGLLAGALFRHLEFPGGHVVIRDEYRIKTGTDGTASFTMNDIPDKMEEEVLRWLIHSCTPIDQVDKGDIKIEFFQGDEKCETKNPVYYRLQDVPKCNQADEPVKRDGKIAFRHITVQELENLTSWEEDIVLL